MKEISPIRRIITAGATMFALGACDQQPQISSGFVYKKEYTDSLSVLEPLGRGLAVPFTSTERSIEVISAGSIYKSEGADRTWLLKKFKSFPMTQSKTWNVSIAQCPTSEPPPTERIEEECKTALIPVPQEVFKGIRLGEPFTTQK